MQSKPPIRAIAEAGQALMWALEEAGLRTRVERSNASRSSLYVYVWAPDGLFNLKVRVSNHTAKLGAKKHRASDFEMLVPDTRVEHVVEEIKAEMRQRERAD